MKVLDFVKFFIKIWEEFLQLVEMKNRCAKIEVVKKINQKGWKIMKKQSMAILSSLAVVVVLGACSPKNSTNEADDSNAQSRTFATEVTHEGTPIKGGTLKYAIVSASPFNGLFIDELSSDSTDSSLSGYVDGTMFEFDENRKLVNSGLASIEFDVPGKSATISLNSKDYKWSDGQPVTIDDYIFTYEGIGHKDYTGIRYDANYKNIEGMEEYHDGKASSITGLEKLDNYSVKIHYKEMSPSMLIAGGPVSAYIMPKHIFSTIPVADWEQSDYVRGTKVVCLGAFTIESITPGEAVTFKANEYYYKGRPKIDKVVAEIVSPDSIVSEMKAGKYDIATMPRSQFETYKDLQNITLLGSFESAYEYIAFQLGKWDESLGKNVMNPNAKMSDPILRQAIAYALDIDQAGKSLYNGLQRGTNSLIIPFFKDIYNKDQEGFTYNPEKAKKMLDDAGYKDVDGDGLRENKDGSKLTINFIARTRDDANESLIQQYLIWWKEIGLDVQLVSGRTLEVNSFYDKVEANEPDIDMYTAGWATGFDPDPTGLYGEDAKFNFTRFVSKEQTAILNKIASEEAFDSAKNVEFYKEWQKYAHDQAFAFPTLVGEQITAVNKRVKYYSTDIATNNTKNAINEMELVADNPVK